MTDPTLSRTGASRPSEHPVALRQATRAQSRPACGKYRIAASEAALYEDDDLIPVQPRRRPASPVPGRLRQGLGRTVAPDVPMSFGRAPSCRTITPSSVIAC